MVDAGAFALVEVAAAACRIFSKNPTEIYACIDPLHGSGLIDQMLVWLLVLMNFRDQK